MAQTRQVGQSRMREIYEAMRGDERIHIRDSIGEQQVYPGVLWGALDIRSEKPFRQAGRQEGRKSVGRVAHKDCRTTRYQITCKFNTLTVRSVQSISKTIVARWFTALQIRAGGLPRETLRRKYRVPDN